MRLTHWLVGLARKQPLSRRFTRRRWHGDLRPAVELLEDRTLLAVTSQWLDGELSIRSDSNDSITVESDAAQQVVVKVNGVVDEVTLWNEAVTLDDLHTPLSVSPRQRLAVIWAQLKGRL